MTAPYPQNWANNPQSILHNSPFLLGLGTRFVRIDEAGTLLEVDLRPEHLNAEGNVHGGVVATLLDAACGFAARVQSTDQPLIPAVTVALNIHYMRPASAGLVRATGHIAGGGRQVLFTTGELRDASGALLATAMGTFKRRGPTPHNTDQETSQ